MKKELNYTWTCDLRPAICYQVRFRLSGENRFVSGIGYWLLYGDELLPHDIIAIWRLKNKK